MKKLLITSIVTLSFTAAANAQIGDILKHADKIKKGAKVVQTSTAQVSWEEELQIGRIVAARVLATYPPSKNASLNEYVKLVGLTLVPYSARPDKGTWTFAVLETDTINAFATPANFVFVTTGALKLMKSEAELAGVLGHEIAHSTQQHVLREVKKANVFKAGLDFAASTSTDYFTADIGKRIGDLAVDRLLRKGIGRNNELDADRLGVEIAAAAGYKPTGIVSFLETLKGLEAQKSSRMQQLGATHPPTADRIKVLMAKNRGTEGATLEARLSRSVPRG